MIKTFFTASSLIAILFVCSCKSNIAGQQVNTSADSVVFFPVHDYFISQLKSADSAASLFLLQRNISGIKASAYINADSVKKLATIFLETDFEKEGVKKFYKETIFEDLTTASFTFSYKTDNEKLAVKNVDVLLDKNTQQVKWVFITRIRQNGDSSITEKLNWHGDKNFSVNRIISLPNNPEQTEQVSVSWK